MFTFMLLNTLFSDEDDPETVLLHDVQLGEEYELVVTGKDGVYRLRMGDIVKITGFFNKAPIFQIMYRYFYGVCYH